MDGGNWTDLGVLGVVLLSALLAFARGFVREVLSVAAWGGAALVALYAYPHVQPLVHQHIGSEVLSNAAAAVGVFLVALIVLSVLAAQLSRGVRGSALSALDRSLGFLFGIARGALLVCLAYLLVAWIYPDAKDQPGWMHQARTIPVIEAGAAQLRRLVPEQAFSAAERKAEAAKAAAQGAATDAIAAQTLQRLSEPVAKSAQPPAAPPAAAPSQTGYSKDARGQMDRMFAIDGSKQ